MIWASEEGVGYVQEHGQQMRNGINSKVTKEI